MARLTPIFRTEFIIFFTRPRPHDNVLSETKIQINPLGKKSLFLINFLINLY